MEQSENDVEESIPEENGKFLNNYINSDWEKL